MKKQEKNDVFLIRSGEIPNHGMETKNIAPSVFNLGHNFFAHPMRKSAFLLCHHWECLELLTLDKYQQTSFSRKFCY